MAPMHSDEYFEFSARYKFVLAMENAVCDDYMTEKLWRPLNIGAVPIVWGSPRVKDFLPSNTSALVVNDFATVEELANFIKYLDSNDEEYKKFLTFKKRGGITNEFLLTHLRNRDWGNRMYPSQRTKPYYSFFPGFECFICQKVHTINEKLERGEKVPNYQASLSHYGCPVPKKFNDVGKATGNSENWIRAWRSGQNMGIAMKHFYSQNITVSRNIYDDYWKKLKNEDKTNNFLQKQMEQ